MLPCLCNGAGKNVSRISAASRSWTSSEPLLFLYPQWFRTLPELAHNGLKDTSHTAKRRCDKHRATHQLQFRRKLSDATYRLRTVQHSSELPNHHVRSQQDSNIPVADRDNAVSVQYGEKSARKTAINRKGTLPHVPPNASPNQKGVGLDARRIARKLAAIPDHLSSPANTKIQLSKDCLEWFTGSSDQNMWFQREGTGCKVYVLPAKDANQSWRHVVLEGSSKSCELTRQKLEAIQSRCEKGSDTLLIQHHRYQHSHSSNSKRPFSTKFVHVDTIGHPAAWDKRSLYDYVKTITEHKPPRTIERKLYLGQDNFDAAAARILSNTFSDSALRSHLTATTIRLALKFFQHRSQLSPSAGLIWNSAFESGIVPDAEFFNIELDRCLMVNNTSRISFLLYMMERFGIRPNAGTWAFLLKLLPSFHERENFIQEFLLERLRHSHSLNQHVALSLIEQDFITVLAEKRGFIHFNQNLQRVLGRDWLTHTTVSAMVKQCLTVQSATQVHEILDAARHSGVDLQKVNEAVLFKAIRGTRHLGDIIAFFKATFARSSARAQHSQIETLFKVAWKIKLFNTCRLLWRYSASHGCITYPMQKLVRDKLARCAILTDPVVLSESNLYCRLASAVVGTSLDLPDARRMFPHLLIKSSTRPAEILCLWQPNDVRRHEQMQLAHLILQRDLTAFEKYQPMQMDHLLLQLKEAVHRDMRWKREKFVQSSSFKVILQQMIKVGLHVHRKVESTDLQTVVSISTEMSANRVMRSSPSTSMSDRRSNTQEEGSPIKESNSSTAFPPEAAHRSTLSTSHILSSI